MLSKLRNVKNKLKKLNSTGHVAYFHYPINPVARYGWGKSPHGYFLQKIEENKQNITHLLNEFSEMKDFLSTIPRSPWHGLTLPYWKNVLLPVIDAVSICGFIKKLQPRKFIEIGSGNSTRFACYAAKQYSPHTEVISIDAYPGDTITAFPSTFIKQGLQETDLSIFDDLADNDIVFMDGSHHSFSNTDVSVFFLDVLPKLKPGTLIGIHDIQLPWDYPPDWASYYFNENFILASYLLGAADNIEYTLPCFYVNHINAELRDLLSPIYQLPELRDLDELKGGGAFWFRKKR